MAHLLIVIGRFYSRNLILIAVERFQLLGNFLHGVAFPIFEVFFLVFPEGNLIGGLLLALSLILCAL